jgi:hypothetical protein
METPITGQTSPSTFVTVLAWIFIVGAGLATFVSLLQALMFAFLFAGDRPPPMPPATSQQMPAIARLFFESPYLFFLLFWSVAVATLVAAIGLLRRRNWARVAFVGLMLLGVVWNLGGLWFQQQMFAAFPKPPGNAGPDFASEFETMANIVRVGSAVFAVAIAALFAWIAKRLMSPAIRAEFERPGT